MQQWWSETRSRYVSQGVTYVQEHQFNERDHLAWSQFMLANIAAIALQGDDASTDFATTARQRLSRAWAGLGAQGVEGAMLSMILSIEAMGCRIKSTQTSPENSEIIVERFPGSGMLEGLEERFEIHMEADDWRELLQVQAEAADQIYDILGAIADGAGVEYLRETTDDGDVRLILRAW
jgi:hypothetical protein